MLARCRVLGTVGATLLALGGLSAGALPVHDPAGEGGLFASVRGHTDLGVACAYFGLTLLVVAWWWLGNRVPELALPELRTTLLLWAAPLLVAPPLFSRDVYSYLAQGAMVVAGLDVYQSGPAVLGGPFAAEVPPIWQHTPAPYGPVFLLPAAAVAAVADGHLGFGVAGMRLLAIASMGLLMAALPGLARRCGVDPGAAIWLGVLNPLVLVHLLAGAHNDALMVALLAAGLAAAAARHPAAGAALVSLATLVKAPAALALVFVAAIWTVQRQGRWRWVRAGAGSGLVAAATLVAVTVVAGTGYGWVDALRTPVSASGWSLPGALDHLTSYLLAVPDLSVWRWLGTALAIGAVVAALLRLPRLGPVYGLGLALTAVALLGPTLRPWYLLWGLVPIAAAAPDGRVRRAAAWTSATAVMLVFPDGEFGPQPSQIAVAVLGSALAIALLAVVHYHDQFPGGLLRRYRGTVSLGDGRLR